MHVELGLIVVFLVVLLAPLTLKIVERNIEMFLLGMGIVTAFISKVLDWKLFMTAATEPIFITLAVLFAGLFFKWLQKPTSYALQIVRKKLEFRTFIFFLIVLLGLFSSMITAIIAALILVFIISELKLGRKDEIRLTILACFAIGIGASISPIGEPLSTIVIGKLNEDFFYLFRLILKEVILALFLFGIMAVLLVRDSSNMGVERK